VVEGSSIVADNYGEKAGRSLNINSKESVTVQGKDTNDSFSFILMKPSYFLAYLFC
jgi:hypothetical protein